MAIVALTTPASVWVCPIQLRRNVVIMANGSNDTSKLMIIAIYGKLKALLSLLRRESFSNFIYFKANAKQMVTWCANKMYA